MGGNGNENGAFYVKDADGNIIITFDNNGITMASGTLIEWDNISVPKDLAYADDIPTNNNQLDNGAGYTTMAAVEGKGYQTSSQVTKITKDTVTTAYVNALGITAKSVSAENITGSIISGKQIEANFAQDSDGYATKGFRVQTDGTAKIHFLSVGGGIKCRENISANGSINAGMSSGCTMTAYYIGAGNGGIATTGVKARTPETQDYGVKTLYCYEMASPVFGDIGDGKLDDTGMCVVFIDDVLAETINTESCEYQVFLSPYGDGKAYVEERTTSYFVVKGTPGLAFGWELKAKQLGYEYERLETHEVPEQSADMLGDALVDMESEQEDTLNISLDIMQAEQEDMIND